MNTTLDKMDCDLTSILTPHSRGSTVLMFRNSGSNFLGILGDYRKAFPSPDSQGKFLSNWLIIPTLDPRKCDTFQVLSLSSSLLGNVKQCTRRYFHKNWCPQELGFMLEMKFPSCPSVIWGLQWGLPHREQTCARQLSLWIKARACLIHLPLHVTYSPSSSKVSLS